MRTKWLISNLPFFISFLLSNTVFCEIQLRNAKIDNLHDLVSLHYHSWHATYDYMLPPTYCAKNNADHLVKYWRKFFAKNDGRFALIALDDGRPAGIITAGRIKHIEQEISWWPCT